MADPGHVEIVKQGRDAISAWRKSKPGVHLDLSGADLVGVNISMAVLAKADLAGANLTGADFSSSNLAGADLSGARLLYANLGTADLSGADLRGAVISRSNLGGSELSGARFHGAQLGMSNFAGAWLQYAEGLDEVVHTFPCSLGTDTLTRARGHLPEAFLRGCGLADWEVLAARLYDPDLSAQEVTTLGYEVVNARNQASGFSFYSVFISYSHADKAFATMLHDALQERGVRCWLDDHQLLPGDDIRDEIDRGIRMWDKVLLLCSERSLSSWWVDQEIEKAVQKEERLWKERGRKVLALVPLDLDGTLRSWEDGKASLIISRKAADFRNAEADPDRFASALELLIRALRADAGGREPPPAPKL